MVPLVALLVGGGLGIAIGIFFERNSWVKSAMTSTDKTVEGKLFRIKQIFPKEEDE